MNNKIKQTFKEHGLKLDEVYETMLYSIKGRMDRYGNGNIGISRKEFKSSLYSKFNITEDQLNYRIRKLKLLGFIKGKGLRYRREPVKYTVSEILLGIYKLFNSGYKFVKNLSNKIINFVNNTDARECLISMGLSFKNYRRGILSKGNGEKIVVGFGNKNGVISIFGKENKSYNTFNFLKEMYGVSVLSLALQLNIK